LDPTKTQLPATITQAEITTSEVHTSLVVPALIADIGDDASWRYVEFFTANIRNHTRDAPTSGRAPGSSPGASSAV
jgi:hypothetical protein